MTRTVRLVLGEPALEIIDVVENRYDTPAPFMLLHHFNLKTPYSDAPSDLQAPINISSVEFQR